MDALQFERWQEFAVRMARHGFPHCMARRIEYLVSEVESWFWHLEGVFRGWPEEMAKIDCWESTIIDGCICDHFNSYFDDDHYHTRGHNYDNPKRNRFHSMLHCCIRAGLDIVATPTGGVVGFTKGDLERMYPEGAPDWITNPEPPWPVPWEQMQSGEGVWL